jgi:glucuronokinase
MIIETRAFARAGLLGNPSDGYFGKTISICVRNFGAHVSLYQSPELCIEGSAKDRNIFSSIYDLSDSIEAHGYYGADRLVKAAIKKFLAYCEINQIRLESKNFTIRFSSSIPRQVGLAGSSAIITATMRALIRFYHVKFPLEILPSLILSAETEELGISAGLQDRVIQVYEGCVYMDFDQEFMKNHGHGVYKRINPALLPNLYIAYRTELSKVSGQVLNDIGVRYRQGDQIVITTLNEIADLAESGKAAIETGDIRMLGKQINTNFDLREKIMNISTENKEMIETARNCGTSAKFAGSGGSIIGIYNGNDMLNQLIVEMKKIKARVIRPYII